MTADHRDHFCKSFEWERVSKGQLSAVMICQCWLNGAKAMGLWMWIKVQLRLLVSAALFTKTKAIDFLLVLRLNCTNSRFPTLPPRHFNYSHDSHHRSQSNSVNVQCSHDEM